MEKSEVKTKQGFFLRIQNSTKPQAFDSVVESLSRDGVGCFLDDKDSATESKACGLVKFWILRKKPCFVLTYYDRIKQQFFH